MTTTQVLLAVALLVGLVCAIGGFVVGWIAHGDDLRRYHTSRRNHLERLEQLAQQQPPPEPPAQRDVIYVPVPVPMPVPMPMPWPGPGPGPIWAPAVAGTRVVGGHPTLPSSHTTTSGEHR